MHCISALVTRTTEYLGFTCFLRPSLALTPDGSNVAMRVNERFNYETQKAVSVDVASRTAFNLPRVVVAEAP